MYTFNYKYLEFVVGCEVHLKHHASKLDIYRYIYMYICS